MKKYLLLTLLITTFFCLKAQVKSGSQNEKIQALKIAFITQKLKLTSNEAEKFWPVYYQYEQEIKSLNNNKNNDDVLENEEQLLNIRKKYRSVFEKILGPERLNDLFLAEKDFRNALLRQLKSRNQKRFQQ